MVLTFSIILLGLLLLIKPLQRNNFYILHSALVILTAYYIESTHFYMRPFLPRTFMMFVVFHIISINIVTFLAYGADKRAAVKKDRRISEKNLHTLEFLGGWGGALIGQKIFNHKTKKQDYQATFWFLVVLQVVIVFWILKLLKLI